MSFEEFKRKRFVIHIYTNTGVKLLTKYTSANKAEDLIAEGITNNNMSFVSMIEIIFKGDDYTNRR